MKRPLKQKPKSNSWTLICATGPSFKRDDALKLKHVGKTIAVNNAIFYLPHADVLYAGDAKWWKHYSHEIRWFKGHRVSTQPFESNEVYRHNGQFKRHGGNSGHRAIQWTAKTGYKNLALLGFDQQFTGGKKHCHDDHPTELGNASEVDGYPFFMDWTATDLDRLGVKVVNLSRQTALTCFERMSVEAFACGL